ncbi:MAG TPA: hypothetical protein VJM08_10970 [Anaerolineales bacterium]|nr:hypothetical protein [Anaerolineales bacterium]
MSQITSMNIGEVNQPKQHSGQTALVCNLTALNAEQRERHQAVLKQLGQASQEVKEVAKGYAFRFLAEIAVLLLLAEFIYLEHRCCPFLEFTLEIKTERGPAWLTVTGPEEVKEFLRAELSLERAFS